MPTLMKAESGLRVQEVVLLVDIQVMFLVQIGLFIVAELVVVSVRFVTYVAVLHVGKGIPLVIDMERCLGEDVAVQLLRVRVVVLVVTVLHQQ